MDLFFLKKLAEKDPALARACEIAIYAAFGYILGIPVSGELFSVQALISAFVSPLLAYTGKKVRDLSDE